MNFKIGFVVTFLLLSCSATAKISCNFSYSDNIKRQYFIKSSLSEDEINCSFLHDVHQTVDRVGSLFDSSPDIFLHIKDKTSNASFDQGHILNFLQTYVRSNKAGEEIYRTGDDVLPILIHEYGHAIVRDRWEKVFPKFEKVYGFTRQLSLNVDEVTEISINLENGVYSKEEEKIKRGRRFSLNKQSSYLAKKIDSSSFFMDQLIPYSELLADVVAVYYLDDKEAISRSIDHPNFTKEEEAYVYSRSFSKAPDYSVTKESPHSLLRKVRYHIGQNYMPSSTNEKKEFYLKINLAVEKEIQRIYFDYEEDSNIADDLILAIDKEFKI